MNAVETMNVILRDYKIPAKCINYQHNDGFFLYDLTLKPVAKVNDLKRYLDEIALALKMPCKPRLNILREQGIVRLEFAGRRQHILNLLDIFTNRDIPVGEINCLLGHTIENKPVWMDLAQNPHLLVAGTTGSGKSVLLHNIIANLFNYNQVDLFLVDPKQIEFAAYADLDRAVWVCHAYAEAVTMVERQIETMEARYSWLRQGNSIADLTPIVIIVDEFADLIMQDIDDTFHDLVCRLSAKCRAVRMHLILATQRPSVDVISGSIKANFPARLSCKVASHVDSRVILDAVGAENLLGKGDALIRDNFRHLERFQIAYTTPQEVQRMFDAK
jgi:DNA segregation ATPase FtsK/SpoIIIE, S-DNA-T family